VREIVLQSYMRTRHDMPLPFSFPVNPEVAVNNWIQIEKSTDKVSGTCTRGLRS
jgi:hypothetical protein